MGRMIARCWTALLVALLAVATPAHADDISAAGRSVVRVVVIAFGEDGEVVDFGHGSGFAVAPNRIVTNAHVVAMTQAQEGGSVTVGVVPSEGHQAYRARVVTMDPARDLALLELPQGSIPSIPLYVGPIDDGTSVAALGYPGNVDLATARSAEDYIRPLPSTRSVGIFSNLRTINGITLLLHTAQIARGNSGGPLMTPIRRWPRPTRCSVAESPPAQFVAPIVGRSNDGTPAGSTTTVGRWRRSSACNLGFRCEVTKMTPSEARAWTFCHHRRSEVALLCTAETTTPTPTSCATSSTPRMISTAHGLSRSLKTRSIRLASPPRGVPRRW